MSSVPELIEDDTIPDIVDARYPLADEECHGYEGVDGTMCGDKPHIVCIYDNGRSVPLCSRHCEGLVELRQYLD